MKKTLAKILTLVMALTLVAVFAGCGAGGET